MSGGQDGDRLLTAFLPAWFATRRSSFKSSVSLLFGNSIGVDFAVDLGGVHPGPKPKILACTSSHMLDSGVVGVFKAVGIGNGFIPVPCLLQG